MSANHQASPYDREWLERALALLRTARGQVVVIAVDECLSPGLVQAMDELNAEMVAACSPGEKDRQATRNAFQRLAAMGPPSPALPQPPGAQNASFAAEASRRHSAQAKHRLKHLR